MFYRKMNLNVVHPAVYVIYISLRLENELLT
jgi:hypothetical protein